MNELRMMKITDVDTSRNQVLIKGKGNKKRCAGLSEFIAKKLAMYLEQVQPQVYLFEGNTPGHPMGDAVSNILLLKPIRKLTFQRQ